MTPGKKPRLLVEGWRFVPHSYSLIHQFQLLALLEHSEIELCQQDAPVALPAWKPLQGLFSSEQEARLRGVKGVAAGFKPDLVYRISLPHDLSPCGGAPVAVFMSPEFSRLRRDAVGSCAGLERLDSSVRLLAPSEWARQAILNSGAATEQVVVLPCGVDPALFHPLSPEERAATRQHYKIGPEEFLFLHCGGMAAADGVDVLLKGFVPVAEAFPQARLFLKGGETLDDSQALLRAAAGCLSPREQELVLPRMRYYGESGSFRQRAQLFQLCDAYVSPYRTGGFNLPVLQALASGLPVLCTRGGSTDDVADPACCRCICSRLEQAAFGGERGTILQPDPEHLTRLMLECIQEPAFRLQARSRGPELVQARLSWKRVAEALLKLLLSWSPASQGARASKAAAPLSAQQLLDQGLKEHRAGQIAEAETLYRQVLQRLPRHPDALYLLGLIVQQSARHAEAIDLFSRAAAAQPKMANAHLQRGFSLQALGRDEEAAAAFRAALALQPAMAEGHHQLGNALVRLGREEEGIAALRQATRLAPQEAIFWLSRGMAHLRTRAFSEAIDCFETAARLRPDLPEASEVLGQAYLEANRLPEARQQLTRTLQRWPNFVEAHHDLGRTCAEAGLIEEAVRSYRAALAIGTQAQTGSNLLFLLHYLPQLSPEAIAAEHRHWNQVFAAPLRSTWQPHDNDPTPHRRLRVGYVSSDLCEHAVVCFFEPVLRAHNHQNFEIFCYANVKKPDAVTSRLRQHADQWRDVSRLSHEQIAALIRQDRIDVLIDLNGHTTDNLLLVFARKPAPVQITWIGYPDTTGLQAMDYRITEAISDPPGQTEAWHSETLVRLPETFSCYRPSEETPAVGPLPALTAGHITFGSFNHFRKLSPPVIALWARLLQAMPTARLLLRSPGLNQPAIVQRLLEQFTRCGVSAERLEFQGARLSLALHLGLYNRVDIGLDPFPYNGTTTTCDALWMGVPVVTLTGQAHLSRVSTSLVTHLGYPEWAVPTPQAYLTRCQELAANLGHLAETRARLREQMRRSPLCDAPRLVGHLEAVLQILWSQWCEKQKNGLPVTSLPLPGASSSQLSLQGHR